LDAFGLLFPVRKTSTYDWTLTDIHQKIKVEGTEKASLSVPSGTAQTINQHSSLFLSNGLGDWSRILLGGTILSVGLLPLRPEGVRHWQTGCD
jgi:hypothetical protein